MVKRMFAIVTRYCSECGSEVEDGEKKGFPYYCPVCGEDLNEFEVNEETEIEESGDSAKETGRGYRV
ncbi:MAG: hypothetical protein IJW05_12115 [Lentisphaeria bacterium]|nr:hypothetical protein [Lentisphaeria bacterium]